MVRGDRGRPACGATIIWRPQQADRALAILQDRVVPDFLHVPTMPPPLALDVADPSMLVETPERLLGLSRRPAAVG